MTDYPIVRFIVRNGTAAFSLPIASLSRASTQPVRQRLASRAGPGSDVGGLVKSAVTRFHAGDSVAKDLAGTAG